VTCIISLYDDLLRPCKVIKHRVGESLASAIEIFNEPDASIFVDVSCSKDGKVMLVSKNSKSSSEVDASKFLIEI
jgi:protease II